MINIVQKNYTCKDCNLQFFSSRSLVNHKQNSCYKRNQLPRSSTVTSENGRSTHDKAFENEKSLASSDCVQEGDVTQNMLHHEQGKDFPSTSNPRFFRRFEFSNNVVPPPRPLKPSKRKRSELALLETPLFHDEVTSTPGGFTNREFVSRANEMFVDDNELTAFHYQGLYPSGNAIDSLETELPMSQNLSYVQSLTPALDMLRHFTQNLR